MPIYTYKKESTGEYRDVCQGMNDKHEYYGENCDENDWKRVFYSPNASIDTNIDPHSAKQFTERTGAKKGTVGDLLDYSKEMSSKRAESNGGIDPVKQKYYENYSKQRKGAKHFDQMKTFENNKIKVEY